MVPLHARCVAYHSVRNVRQSIVISTSIRER
jgi:hypothetical protein